MQDYLRVQKESNSLEISSKASLNLTSARDKIKVKESMLYHYILI